MIRASRIALIILLFVSLIVSGQDIIDLGNNSAYWDAITSDDERESFVSDLFDADRTEGPTTADSFFVSRDTETSTSIDGEVIVSIPNLRDESFQMQSDGSTSPYTNVGFSSNQDLSVYLTFDISDIPREAEITDVELEFSSWDITGNPFSNLGCLGIYPASFDDLIFYSQPSAYARICNRGMLDSRISSPSLRRALGTSLGEDRFVLLLHFDEEMRSESGVIMPTEWSSQPDLGGDYQPDAPSGGDLTDYGVITDDIISGLDWSDLINTPIRVNAGFDRTDLSSMGITPDEIKRAIDPGRVRISQEQIYYNDYTPYYDNQICYDDSGNAGVWRYDPDGVQYCDATYSLSCPEGYILDSSTRNCCQDSNENEICDYSETHLIYIGAANLIIRYSLPISETNPTIPDPILGAPEITIEGAPNLGTAVFKLPSPSSLIDASLVGWGEVPANQVLVTMNSSMSFEDARQQARQLASDLGGSVVGEFEYLNLFQIETSSQTLSQLWEDINFASGYELAVLALPNHQLYREPSPAGTIYQGDFGRGYRMIGVEEAWNAIFNESIDLYSVRVGIIDDGLYPGREQFNGTDIDTSIELYPGAPPNLLSERRLPEYEATGSHGTGIASILTANPTSGLVGIAFAPLSMEGRMKVYMINVLDATGKSFVTSSLLGFKGEIEQGSTILSCSLGNTGDPEGMAPAARLYENFFTYISQDHPRILFVFSAGNKGIAIEGDERIPNGRTGDLPNVITVGNIFSNGTLVPSSNRNKDNHYVTLAAPGEEAVWGIYDDGSLWNINGGTSMAAPQVTAAAALIRSINPLLNAGEIKEILKGAAHYDIGGNNVSDDVGGLALNIDRAVKKAIHERPPEIEILNDAIPIIDIPEDSSSGITGRPDANSAPAGGFATVTISSDMIRGYSVIVDGLIAGRDGIGGDTLDGLYTFQVTGDEQHTIMAITQYYQEDWPEIFFNAGGIYSLRF